MKTALLIVIIFLKIGLCFSQDSNMDKLYFENLLLYISNNKNIIEYKMIIDKYGNGKLKRKEIRVVYKNDPEKRYWQIGESFEYYKNGLLKGHSNVDPYFKVLIDTAIGFYKNGSVHRKFICLNDSNYTQVPLYSSFSKVWVSYPIRYRLIVYGHGKIFYESEYEFIDNSFLLDGNRVFYKKDGQIDEIIHYKKGKRIKK